MKRTWIPLTFILSAGAATAQTQTAEPPARTREAVDNAIQATLHSVTERAGVKPRRVLFVGTFHFDDQGLDEYKPTHHFDALSERRQKEIAEIIDRLDNFDADVVCVERRFGNKSSLDNQFNAYTDGKLDLGPNEIHQIGFRLAEREHLEGVSPVDAEARWHEPVENPETWAKENDQAGKLRNPLQIAFFPVIQERDRLIDAWHLTDTLLAINSETYRETSNGMYLTGAFQVGDGESYPGVDGFVSAWHNRNLRIFQNILNASEPGDNVVVLIGAGHVPLLSFMAQCTPEVELVDLIDVLGDEAAETGESGGETE
ncbi:MAG: hypothetical protein KDA31_07585 [Phycisphaerales bacterium]|nr:hypothetical protein [Phycisphaerales bacterium]MCB9836113.1 hypothetical protein [Phycisphaera sp.]